MARHGQGYSQLLDPTQVQVFILCCPANIPLCFGLHPWFVCNEYGKVSRYEVLHRKRKTGSKTHVYRDTLAPFSGIDMWPVSTRWYWRPTLLGVVEGASAERMLDVLRKSETDYPYREQYALLGKNSNTYAQWILNQFPEVHIRLPWNCFGKGRAALDV